MLIYTSIIALFLLFMLFSTIVKPENIDYADEARNGILITLVVLTPIFGRIFGWW